MGGIVRPCLKQATDKHRAALQAEALRYSSHVGTVVKSWMDELYLFMKCGSQEKCIGFHHSTIVPVLFVWNHVCVCVYVGTTCHSICFLEIRVSLGDLSSKYLLRCYLLRHLASLVLICFLIFVFLFLRQGFTLVAHQVWLRTHYLAWAWTSS